MLLDIDHLQAGYDDDIVLHDISLCVGEGEFITLLGRNGMGKSTIIKAVMGWIAPRAGSIMVGGQALAAAPHVIARAGIGLVPEGRRVFATLTVHENLVAFVRTHGPWTPERVYRLFPRLQERRRALARTLSGGEQQMLAIGRALVTNPRLLILDEATEGLSPIASAEIWEALAELSAEGLAIIAVDKSLAALLALADRHYVIEKGHVMWSGSSTAFADARDRLQAYLGV